jgi:2-keto-4-pentenoate hydratase
MALSEKQIAEVAVSLIQAARDRKTITPLTDSYPELTLDEAYRVQQVTIESRLDEGARVVGKKIGLTSPAMQQMFGVNEPDYGQLLDTMLVLNGEGVAASKLLQPRIEGEIAFVIERDLKGPGLTVTDVVRATGGVTAALEIIDSRIRDWKIKIQDTVADNASSSGFVLGSRIVPMAGLDLRYVGFLLTKNGRLAATAAGGAVLGNPVQAVAWLANKMGEYDIGLNAGDVILSGSAVAAVPVGPGDSIHLNIDRIGDVSCYFS